jgi:response regulator RpfG family c-di-GMP phosphodiesterase
MTAIIVVDDQTSNRLIMAKLAATVEENVEVKAFSNPLQALKYAADHTPDLLITDFKMKPIDGDEFIRRFRQVRSCADVPAVVVTAFQDVDYRDRAIEAGSTDFLLSPIDHNEFRTRSRSLLAQWNRRKFQTFADRATSIAAQADTAIDEPALVESQVEMLSDMLLTVNVHLAATLADLEIARNDLDRLGEISQVAAIFVDSSMRVRRFTHAAGAMFSLHSSDIGRYLAEIPLNLIYPDLAADFTQVSETGELMEKYLQEKNGFSHYAVRILPYRNGMGSVDGAAITFSKIGLWYSGQG